MGRRMSAMEAIASTDAVPRDAPGTREIGFSVPARYNASAILFDNLAAGRGDRCAVTGPAGTRTYAELAADAAAFGAGLLSLGLQRGDRVLLFLDDTPAYPAALFGAIRAGLVPLLINTLTPSDLLQFYLADSGARRLRSAMPPSPTGSMRRPATARALETLVVVNGEAAAPGPVATQSAARVARRGRRRRSRPPTRIATTWRSGCTRRARRAGPRASCTCSTTWPTRTSPTRATCWRLSERDVCFSVPKIFFAYGLGNSITFPFAVGASSVLLPGQPKPAAIFDCIARYRPTVFFGLPTLYTALTKAPEAQVGRPLQPAPCRVGRRGALGRGVQRAGRRCRASRSWRAWAPPRCCTSISPTRPR